MKATFLTLLLPFIAQMAFGQTLPTLEDPDFNQYFSNPAHVPTIKGKINNLPAAEKAKMLIEYSIVVPYGELAQIPGHVPVNPDGTFEIKLQYAFPNQQVWITVDSLFFTGVYVNSEVILEMDAEQLKAQEDPAFISPGVQYLGRDGHLNQYINHHILFNRERQLEIDEQLQQLRFGPRPNHNAYIKSFDSLYTFLHEIDRAYITQNPSEYASLILNERQSDYLALQSVAHWQSPLPDSLFKKIAAHKPVAVSNAGTDYYKTLLLLMSYNTLKKRAAEKKPNNVQAVTEQTIHLLDSLFTPNKADIFKLQLSSKDLKEQKITLETTLPSIKTTWCKQVMNDQHQLTVEKLASIQQILSDGKPVAAGRQPGQAVAELSFGARLFQIEKMPADSFLALLKASFPGKALFIDLWATWCGPCIAEFPHSKKLSADSKDLPVEFVYLCTTAGSDMDKWKTKIAEHQISGTHIFVEKSLVTDLMNLFSASGFPSYVFISAAGEYKPGAIQRPSQMSRAALAELLK